MVTEVGLEHGETLAFYRYVPSPYPYEVLHAGMQAA